MRNRISNPKVDFGKYKDKTLTWVKKNDYSFFLNIEKLYLKKYDSEKQQYYLRIKNHTGNNVPISIMEDYKNYIQIAIDLMRAKKSRIEIISYFNENFKISPKILKKSIAQAGHEIKKEFELERNFLLDIHLLRYEEIFFDNFNIDVSHIPPGYQKAIKSEHYATALDTLFQKEKLLGIHTKNFKAKFNNINILEQKDLDYDLSKLTMVEKLEVIELLEKAKNIEKLNRPIIVDDNPLNVEQIVEKEVKEIISPIKYSKETDIKKEKEKLEEVENGKSLYEVKEVIENNLKEKVKALFNKNKDK